LVLARGIVGLKIDRRIAAITAKSPGLDMACLPDVIGLHLEVARVVYHAVGRASDTFTSYYLHFCRPGYFPIFDPAAERAAQALMARKALDGKPLILGRYGYDYLPPDASHYERLAIAVLALQTALEDEGLGRYALRELDKYLITYA
jgi:hypothetical protein